eukprot:68179_1
MNALLILNSTGECIIQQNYRINTSIHDYVNKFKTQITSNDSFDTHCVLLIEPYSFIFIHHNDLIICAITNTNCNIFNILSLEFQFIKTMQSYSNESSETFNTEFVSNNLVLTLEILHEMVDGGYPQSLPDNTLLIHPKPKPISLLEEARRQSRDILCQVTGAVAWRKHGIKYNMGFSVGGAKDVSTFRDCIQNRILPKPSSLTYNGLFYDYYFQNINPSKKGQDEQDEQHDNEGVNKLFYPSYCYAKCENDYYISVGLNSNMKTDEWKRNKLNLMILLDISGSMKTPFTRQHNDMIEEDGRSKMNIAKECLIQLITTHLDKEDTLSIILFNHKVHILQEFVRFKDINIAQLIEKIKVIKAGGGTKLFEPFETAVALFESLKPETDDAYDNRVIYLTDAQQNLSYSMCNRLIDICKTYSLKSLTEGRICTTFIGVGIDFNTDLVNQITSELYGANYYAIHSAKAFNNRMVDEFDLMVSPLIFNLKLEINEEGNDKGYHIDAIYGHSNDADMHDGVLMNVKTLFPSRPNEDSGVKGGIILLKIQSIIKDNTPMQMEFKVSYQDRFGNTFGNKERVCLDRHSRDKVSYYDNHGIRKAVLLVQYVQLLKQWIGNSVSFYISSYYRRQFERFMQYFRNEMLAIDDPTLKKEVAILTALIESHDAAPNKADVLPLSRAHAVFVQVTETISVTMNNNNILHAAGKGTVLMNSNLSGMPYIRMGMHLNHGQFIIKRKHVNVKRPSNQNMNYRFHPCVRLNRFDADKEVMFIPPDGQFELLSYDIHQMKNIKVPFDVVHDIKYESDCIDYDIRLIPQFEARCVAKDVIVKIPMNIEISDVRQNEVKATIGDVELGGNHLVWNISVLHHERKARLNGRLWLKKENICGNRYKADHGLKDISVQFGMNHKIMSSLRIRYLNVMEPKLNYKTYRQVQYITKTDDANNLKFRM